MSPQIVFTNASGPDESGVGSVVVVVVLDVVVDDTGVGFAAWDPPPEHPATTTSTVTAKPACRRSPRISRSVRAPLSGRLAPGVPMVERVLVSLVTVEKPQPHTALVTRQRPERLNAMSIELAIELDDALRAVAYDNDVYVVVLAGAGRYRDRFERVDGGLRFNEREMGVEQVGDVREHLAFDLAGFVDGD